MIKEKGEQHCFSQYEIDTFRCDTYICAQVAKKYSGGKL